MGIGLVIFRQVKDLIYHSFGIMATVCRKVWDASLADICRKNLFKRKFRKLIMTIRKESVIMRTVRSFGRQSELSAGRIQQKKNVQSHSRTRKQQTREKDRKE